MVRVSLGTLTGMFKDNLSKYVPDAPDDISVAGVANSDNGWYYIILRSDSFKELDEGEPIPETEMYRLVKSQTI